MCAHMIDRQTDNRKNICCECDFDEQCCTFKTNCSMVVSGKMHIHKTVCLFGDVLQALKIQLDILNNFR